MPTLQFCEVVVREGQFCYCCFFIFRCPAPHLAYYALLKCVEQVPTGKLLREV
jgi:hypothetical protein